MAHAMTYFFGYELKRQLRFLSQWLTAAGLFAASNFIVGWPLRDDLELTRTVGPSAILAFLIISQYLVLSSFWMHDIRSGIVSAITAHKNSVLASYTSGRALAGICVGWLYAAIALGLGMLFFAIPAFDLGRIAIQVLAASPAITALSLATACLVNGSKLNASALGMLVLVPLLAPILIFSNIYWQASILETSLLPNALYALVGISLFYCTATLSTLPSLLKSQA